jgi:hypothetical protein
MPRTPKTKTARFTPLRSQTARADGRYQIAFPNKPPEWVQPVDIAYDAIGIRHDKLRFKDHTWVLDHIPTGQLIGTFRSKFDAIQASAQLIQITNFKWNKLPSKEIGKRCAEIIAKYH